MKWSVDGRKISIQILTNFAFYFFNAPKCQKKYLKYSQKTKFLNQENIKIHIFSISAMLHYASAMLHYASHQESPEISNDNFDSNRLDALFTCIFGWSKKKKNTKYVLRIAIEIYWWNRKNIEIIYI